MKIDNYSRYRRFRILYISFMIGITIFGISDIIMNYYHIKTILHKIAEVGFVIIAVASGTYMWYSNRLSEKNLIEANSIIGEQKEELIEWKRKHGATLLEMREIIIERFKKWGLTPSEVELAIYLIRGFSHKQISGLLEKSERTVRNQSISIYKKTGMTGRSELAAYFLEDIFELDEDDEDEN